MTVAEAFMRNKKIFFARLAVSSALLLFSLLLASCGKAMKPSGTSIAILLPHDAGNAGFLESVTGGFTKKTGIHVKLQEVDKERLHENLVSAFSSGNNAYDVIYVDANWTAEFAKAKWLEPLDAQLSESERKNIFTAAISAHTFEGKLYAMPWNSRVWALMYNEGMLHKAGYSAPPQTWDEFVNIGLDMRLKRACNAPVIWTWKEHAALVDSFIATTLSFGGKIFDRKDTPQFNQKEGLLALEFMISSLGRISDPASLTDDYAAAANSYMTGSNCMMTNWHTWNAAANASPSSKIRGQSRFAPMPAMAKNLQASLLDVEGLGIPSSAKHKDEAAKFIKYIMSGEAQRAVAEKAGRLPTLKSLYKDPELLEVLPLLPQYAAIVQSAKPVPKPSWYEKFLPVMQNELQLALTGKKQPKQAMDDAAKEAKKLAAQDMPTAKN